MNIEQLITLGNMGYTKEDIAAMMQPVATPAAPAQPVAAQATPAQPVATPAAPVQPVATQATPAQPVATPAQPASVDFLEALKMLGAAMQQPAAPAQPVATPAAPAQPVATPAQPAVTLTADELLKLTQGIAVKTAGGTLETPRTSDSIILGMLDAYEQTEKEK